MTKEAGLRVVSYGSYYRVGSGHARTTSFEEILETALELDAPAVRVWAGTQGSQDADEAYWHSVISDTRRIADLAYQQGVYVNFECHNHTLTDTTDAACRLMAETSHRNVGLYWQPRTNQDVETGIQG